MEKSFLHLFVMLFRPENVFLKTRNVLAVSINMFTAANLFYIKDKNSRLKLMHTIKVLHFDMF